MNRIKKVEAFVGSREEKFYKTTLFNGEFLMIGLNCFEPGQRQKVHDHADQDKFYYVVSGTGRFTVGEEETDVPPGAVVFAPAGIRHGVTNVGEERLVVLMGIAPPPR